MTEELSPEIIAGLRIALAEDIGPGDATTDSIVPGDATAHGHIIAKEDGVVAGLDVAQVAYLMVDPRVDFTPRAAEGASVRSRQVLAEVTGPPRALLTAERTALNYLGRMSGIATLTHRFVDAVAGTCAVILDTRKTAPGLRHIDKLAVKRGGGQNHRVGLYDMILIKDNHIDYAGSLAEAVRRARAAETGLEIEVETRTLEDVRIALELGVNRILLDNMPPEMMRRAVEMSAGTRAVGGFGQCVAGNCAADCGNRRGFHFGRRADPFGAHAGREF